MTDREKVIAQLTADMNIAKLTGESLVHITRETVETALAMLREQEPVKPTEKDGWHYCGACGRSIDSDFADEEVFLYCPNCGRKVKCDD